MGCQTVQYKLLWEAERINYYAIDSDYFMRGVQQTGMNLWPMFKEKNDYQRKTRGVCFMITLLF